MAKRQDPPPGHDTLVGTEPCPQCGSPDNLKRYADGHAHCFSQGCGYHEPATEGEPAPAQTKKTAGKLLEPGPQSYRDWRGLKADTLRRYGFFLTKFNKQDAAVGPNYSQDGRLVSQKVRLPGKAFPLLELPDAPSLNHCQLFGQHVFGQRFDRKVVVTEGYEDAMSVAQAMNFKIAAYSVTTGAEGAKKCLQANYRELDRYEEIILWFDDDEPGRAAAAECAQLFDVGKVKIAKAPGHKDANACLQANKPGDIEAAIYMATVWRPAGIVNAADGLDELIEEGFQVPSWPYPWEMMNDRTMGMRRGEITYHVGGTGIAKTTILFHFAVHLLMWDGKPFVERVDPTTGEVIPNPPERLPKIGWFGFEDNLKTVRLGLLSIHAGRRLHLSPLPKEKVRELAQELFGSRRLELYNPEEAEYGLDATMGYIKYLAKALECDIIVIDPLTELVASLPTKDRTAAEDRLAAGLHKLAKSLGICLHIGYHLRKPDGTPFEEGAEIGIPDVKGSGALTHFSNNVFAYERDQQGERPDLLRIRGVKVRFTGLTGEFGLVKYDPLTGRYTATTDKWPEPKKNKSRGGFGKAPSSDKEFGQDF
jgi:twinkle protein